MAKHILINRENGKATLVRSEIETSAEDPLTEDEILINELYNKINKIVICSNCDEECEPVILVKIYEVDLPKWPHAEFLSFLDKKVVMKKGEYVLVNIKGGLQVAIIACPKCGVKRPTKLRNGKKVTYNTMKK